MSDSTETCSNCDSTENVKRVSFDMDLPTVVLCLICRFTISTDLEMFERMGNRRD